MPKGKGFLRDTLFERHEKQIFLEVRKSEFVSLECFWVLFAEKVPNESSISYGFHLALANLLMMRFRHLSWLEDENEKTIVVN